MIPRLYSPRPLSGDSAVLGDEAAHHVTRVLRLRDGDAVLLFDGSGGEWPGVLRASGRGLSVALGGWRDVEREARLAVTLAQALPAGDKMDWVVQKAVELGAAVLQPLETRRSVVRLAGERAAKRARHWQQVAVAACEQCGRNRVPTVAGILELSDYLAAVRQEDSCRLLLSPRGAVRLATLPPPHGPLTLLIGPEGGLDEGEEDLARLAGFQAITLGPRVLRSETAGLAAIAAIMALWGDF